jgi:hypothetical protein
VNGLELSLRRVEQLAVLVLAPASDPKETARRPIWSTSIASPVLWSVDESNEDGNLSGQEMNE